METLEKEIIQPSLGDKVGNFIGFVGVHIACFGAIWTGVSSRALAIAFVLYWTRMFLITGGYHRYFAHRSYKTSRAFQFVLAFLGTTAMQKGTIWWSARHRIHHKHSDEPEDIHSPKIYGFWRAHIGWFLCNKESGATDLNRVKDLVKFPELRWLDKYHWVAPIMLTGLCYYLDGWSGMIIGLAWSTVVFWHSTFLVNSIAHMWGSRRYQTNDDSRNNPLIAFLTMGEGWHNNHHHFQGSVKQGFKWWEIDLTYYILRLLALTGLIWDLNPVPKNKLESSPKEKTAAL
jgi:stearoyl-CoA desaturase (delta-9 desaturase)